jgi:hypothetical protein
MPKKIPRLGVSFHVRQAMSCLLDCSDQLRSAADLLRVGDSEAAKLLRLSRLADSVVTALENRYRVRVQQ